MYIRLAAPADLDFLVKVDLEDEGITHDAPNSFTEQDLVDHRAKIAAFLSSPGKAAWVAEDPGTRRRVGAILCVFHDRLHDEPNEANEFLFKCMDDAWVPPDGRFCEVFNLWVDPGVRRQGLATRLKQQMEIEARRRGIRLIYTHTEARNEHVITLNQKLGYREIRRGPIWDSIIRVSLIKTLE